MNLRSYLGVAISAPILYCICGYLFVGADFHVLYEHPLAATAVLVSDIVVVTGTFGILRWLLTPPADTKFSSDDSFVLALVVSLGVGMGNGYVLSWVLHVTTGGSFASYHDQMQTLIVVGCLSTQIAYLLGWHLGHPKEVSSI